MVARRFFACPLCTEEFALPADAVRRRSRAVVCPCCGSVEVIDLGLSFSSGDDVETTVAGAA